MGTGIMAESRADILTACPCNVSQHICPQDCGSVWHPGSTSELTLKRVLSVGSYSHTQTPFLLGESRRSQMGFPTNTLERPFTTQAFPAARRSAFSCWDITGLQLSLLLRGPSFEPSVEGRQLRGPQTLSPEKLHPQCMFYKKHSTPFGLLFFSFSKSVISSAFLHF